MSDHDPLRFATSLSAKLATRSRHVCFFLGAGTAKACGLPDVAKLKELVVKGLNEQDRKDFSRQLEGRNLEQALSRLRRISVLLIGNQELENLNASRAEKVDRSVCQ